MSIRRLFWLGAAVLFSIAALVAIVAVLGGSFGTTQEHILEMCGIAFVCGAATLAGLGCIDRGVISTVGWLTVVLGVATFVVWTGAVWQRRRRRRLLEGRGHSRCLDARGARRHDPPTVRVLAAAARHRRTRDVGGRCDRGGGVDRDDPR